MNRDLSNDPIRLLCILRNPKEFDHIKHLINKIKSPTFELYHSINLDQAENTLNGNPVDVILLDLQLEDSSGFQTYQKVASWAPNSAIIALTHDKDKHSGLEAFINGAQSYWIKGEMKEQLLIQMIQHSLDRKASEDKLQQLSYHDHLTDLPNRTLFMDRLSQAITASKRYRQLGAILFLGLDRFKRINNTLGHAVGDELLKAVGERLGKSLYETDTVTRIGGDVFAVLLPQVNKYETAIKVANKLIAVFEAPFHIRGFELHMSVSAGLSFFPIDGREPERLMGNANFAMGLAKKKGPNCYQIYSSAMNTSALERLEMENSLRYALERNELRLFYQPFYDLRIGEITGMEALIRWEHPTLGLLHPSQFVSIAEETGLIVPMGIWVLKTACRQTKLWRQNGYSNLKVAINLSDLQVRDRHLTQTIRDILVETDLEPAGLELELTENIVMENVLEGMNTLEQLKSQGINFSIDDFGMGYSSLSALKQMPITTLKIDRSFVSDISSSPDNGEIAKAIISMGHSLNLEVLAEGVETQDQLDFLTLNSCDKIQGFFFSHPLPEDQFQDLLAEKSR